MSYEDFFMEKLDYANKQHERIGWWIEEEIGTYAKVPRGYEVEHDVDLEVHTHDDRYIHVEEKFNDSPSYKCIAIETIQNTKENSPGWIHVSDANILLYCHCAHPDYVEVFRICMSNLQEYYNRYGHLHKHKVLHDKPSKPEVCLIPWDRIRHYKCGYSYYKVYDRRSV